MNENTRAEQDEMDRRINEVAAGLSYPDAPPLGPQLTAIRAKISEAETVRAQPLFTPWRLVISTLVLGLAVLVIWRWLQPAAILAQPGEMLSQTLSDGSTVYLRAESRLELARGFNEENRELSLQGEAFFRVEKGRHPFRITVNQTHVTVLGTRFNVRARGDSVSVEVSEGKVLFSEKSGNKQTFLQGGERAVYREGAFSSPQQFTTWEQPAWMSNTFVFREQTLGDLCTDIERQFNTRILVSPELADRIVTGRLKAEDAESLMAPLSTLVGASWRPDGDGYVIEPK